MAEGNNQACALLNRKLKGFDLRYQVHPWHNHVDLYTLEHNFLYMDMHFMLIHLKMGFSNFDVSLKTFFVEVYTWEREMI